MPKPEDFDYSMMVNDLELVNSLIKTVIIRENDAGESTHTDSSIIHIDGLEYVDCPTDNHGPIMKATILKSGPNRQHMSNFRDRTETHCFGMIRTIFKHYYTKDGETWKSTCKNGYNHIIHYA
jgi:hypothetical protein